MRHIGFLLLLSAGPLLAQGPGIIAIGSPLTVGGANAPETFTASTTFSSTPVVVNNGRLRVWQEQAPTGSNGEWDIFYFETVGGGPLAGNFGAEWNIVIGYTLTKAVIFDGVANQFLANGTPLGPVSNIGGICCAATTSPIFNGPQFYNPGGGTIPAGPQNNWRQIFISPYSFLSSAGVDINRANQFKFALHFTVPQARPAISSVISAGAFGAYPSFAPGSWIEIFGSNLAVGPQQWSNDDFRGLTAPTSLSGASVTIGGQQAFVGFISPGQMNVVVPGGVQPGPQNLVVTTPGGASAPFPVTVDAVRPGVLAPATFRVGGAQYAAVLLPDGSFALPPGAIAGVPSRRARTGETIVIYGIGFGAVTPAVSPGQIAAGTNSLAAPFAVTIGGAPASVVYNGLAPGFVGLYQFNVVVPAIAANDTAALTVSLAGQSVPQTAVLAVGN